MGVLYLCGGRVHCVRRLVGCDGDVLSEACRGGPRERLCAGAGGGFRAEMAVQGPVEAS